MEKMQMRSKDLAQEKLERLEELFPGCITEEMDAEGKLHRKLSLHCLEQFLSLEGAEGEEAYAFTWPGKKAAIAEANRSIRKTLRPVRERSMDWEKTENLYIEGDNLEVLKLLRESYLGKVKVIYIDPPYNTGTDLIYRDDFESSAEEYEQCTGIRGENQEKLFKNADSSGRFHSNWCSMIFSRLLLARDLLTEDGVIFISIDDHEQENLKKICNEVFGEHNFLAQIVWERAFAPVNLKKHFSESHDFILCYARHRPSAVCQGLPRSGESDARYSNPDQDERGPWTSGDLSVGPAVPSRIYEIVTPSGRKVLPPNGYCWRLDRETFEQYKADNRIWFGADGDNVPRIKRFLSEVKQGITPTTIWKYTDVGSSQDATKELKKIFGGKAFFDYPKPVRLVRRCIRLYGDENCIVMDFFSGSGTTAQAVLEQNAEDGGHRKFIMVQCDERLKETSEAYRAGFQTICDIGEERVRRAGAAVKAKHPAADTGFRVFRLDDSNMEEVYYVPGDYTQELLPMLESNIKSGRTGEDLFFGCLLEWGIPLSLPCKEELVHGHVVNSCGANELIACFEEKVPAEVVEEIAKRRPRRAVFRDSSFWDSASRLNLEELFRRLSPDTRIKVI